MCSALHSALHVLSSLAFHRVLRRVARAHRLAYLDKVSFLAGFDRPRFRLLFRAANRWSLFTVFPRKSLVFVLTIFDVPFYFNFHIRSAPSSHLPPPFRHPRLQVSVHALSLPFFVNVSILSSFRIHILKAPDV